MFSHTRALVTVGALALTLALTGPSPVLATEQSGTTLVAAASPAAAAASPAAITSERFSIHAQTTTVQQYHGAFRGLDGPQSITSLADTAKTIDATLYLGARIGRSTEVYINPELDQGFGLGNPPASKGLSYNGTFGAAGFPSAEAYKVGRDQSYGRVHRAFVRQTFNFGGSEPTAILPDINQLGGSIDPKHVIVTAGKFGAVDIFDNNPYAHDPRNDFLNWSIVDLGSFDYPADAWGYTYGLTAEITTGGNDTLRAGVFQLSSLPNQVGLEKDPLKQYGTVLEYERRTTLFGGHPGSVKFLAYQDTGYMGAYADAVAAAVGTNAPPSTANIRQNKHAKFGGGVNISQEIAPNIGVFARASAMNGRWETIDFSDIDRALSGGLSINGAIIRRPGDTLGIAGAINGISAPAQAYFAAGGVGVLAGDGTLSYGTERIFETYYKAGIGKNFAVTLDYQHITNPAYNRARGPINILGLRYRANI